MTDSNTQSAGKMLTRASVYGTVSLALYFLLYFFEDFILEFTSRGGWYFIAPVVIAFVFSYFHGAFTSHFWDTLGIKAKK
ncbi:MAG: hypothetical protein A3E57_07700 [Candidatus Muproteobacteria bacterium RIFCSPHIGHO2_12_FULL_60_33]|uniref:Uncharacterized protein n=1 Tax=Candidatus Muproteobacteria bacterium RIFCSPLOWO2_01_FULL_60_18 TaxID=1817768 RepID=A0A1F6TYZ6_9PROT|nr:MAG: hypothetical protein A3A87_02390 [Candidatus Muproteobacteria bacterium RIFCSPLOWO2_01_FULL_60_18]OGI53328.1 MAG: hypothetical protein A2W42_07175 [Candidatus Muproteobacteria bacterium RIFCSPHIGHO2_01_60_12]OGI54466.1 MAG: hypothetical protein A3E57_07700 [Candidatus Muproteobacteria bacterium RIFCSPHIGHO2_12_FULL_60_33]OGI55744.1 MAG: hypothetical protein A3D32_05935 [Candidatus Muproteobacteria bacterium RIFCSPHIGHO2_02_FULL_60_13]